MSSLSTHVLDTALGSPAAGVRVALQIAEGDAWLTLGEAATNADGRIAQFTDAPLAPGTYRLRFDTGAYQTGFFPEVIVTFTIAGPARHYHVPLLLSPYGYSTYRGS